MNDLVIRILLVDSHAIVLAGIRLLLETNPSFRVVGEAGNSADALALAAREQPDVILLDPELGTHFDPELISSLLEVAPLTRVLLMPNVQDPDLHAQAVSYGAIGVVVKSQTPEMLFKAITKVTAGEVWLDRATTAHLLTRFSKSRDSQQEAERQKIAALTCRETEIIALVSQGLKNKQIAERLSISEVTVRHHLSSIFSKLGISDRLELLLYAYGHGLAIPPQARFDPRSSNRPR